MMKFNNVFTKEAPRLADLFSYYEDKLLHVNLWLSDKFTFICMSEH